MCINQTRVQFLRKELMALLSEAISNSLKGQALIPDALENLAKSTVRNRQKVEQTILPLQRKYLYQKKQVTRANQAEVADHQVNLRKGKLLLLPKTLEQLTKPAKAICRRKPVSYEITRSPRVESCQSR